MQLEFYLLRVDPHNGQAKMYKYENLNCFLALKGPEH